jgi:hypothetical protein
MRRRRCCTRRSPRTQRWNRYPGAVGTPEFRAAALGYLARRYPGTRGRIDAELGIRL